MIIKPYKIQDKEAVLRLFRLNTPQYFGPDEEGPFLQYLADDFAHYFVVELDERIVGCGGINYFHDEQLARISWDIIVS